MLTWIKGIGIDAPSAVYKKNDGSMVNSGAISTFLTRSVISENRVVKIPEKFPLREAALLGCAMPTGAGIVINTANVTSGKGIAIFGMCGIGLSALLVAKIRGASTIIAVDISDERIRHANTLGATHILNAAKDDIVREIMKITNNKGVDYAVESAGKKEAMETAFRSVCDKGGLCIIAGNLSHGQAIEIDPFDLIKGKRVIGTWGGETRPDEDIPLYAEWTLSGKLDLGSVIFRVYRIRDINEAVECMEKQAVGRVLIAMDES